MAASVALVEGVKCSLEIEARQQNPVAENSLMYLGNCGGWGRSPLDKINAGNVGKLPLAGSLATGQTEPDGSA